MNELAPATQTACLTDDSRQYLVFSLGDEEYGIEIIHVQEIKSLTYVAQVPNAPEYVKGVLNLRGSIIPIVDLRLRISMPPREYDRFTVIIVVAIEDKQIGLVVDGVSDVLDISTDDIDDSPPLANDLETTWFLGVGKRDVGEPSERLVFLLDIHQLTKIDAVPNSERLAQCSN